MTKNLELAKKELTLAESVDKELAVHLIGDALENIVSAFDGFGREICVRKGQDIQFQNLTAARRRVQERFAIDFGDVLSADEWEKVYQVFQKRHLIAHRMGVVDEDYIKKANDSQAVLGRKIGISRDEVLATINLIERLGKRLFEALIQPTP